MRWSRRRAGHNIAVIGGLEPLFEREEAMSPLASTELRIGVVVVVNVLVILCLYAMRSLYGLIERAMKVLILMMVAAFFVNFLMAIFGERVERAAGKDGPEDWLPLVAMIGTTFSVAGAFFQAYLVKEKGWGMGDLRKGVVDSVVGISFLGGVTAVILMTSVLMFYRAVDAPNLVTVGDVARQMEPLFGSTAKYIFSAGILAGAFSSFLVNAMIGGTVMSDGLGLGSRMEDRWARHFTTAALLTGMVMAIRSFAEEGSTVKLITVAQALTVLGIPALAAALLFLATRRDLTGERRMPVVLLVLASVGTLVACFLAARTAVAVYAKLTG
jgi:Mn2+/Fe2+ NRAMP family transporter